MFMLPNAEKWNNNSHVSWTERERSAKHSKKRTPVESIAVGGGLTAVFGALFFIRGGEWWWLFPMAFAGLIPLVGGISRLFTRRRTISEIVAEHEADAEKLVLGVAEQQRGKLTAATTALRTGLTIREVQEILERMTKNGHAVVNVTSEGILEFEFPEFRPRSES
jgi:hypothetical protein